MIIRNTTVINGNRFLAELEDTDFYDMYSDPAPDGYTSTLEISDLKDILDEVDSDNLRGLYEFMKGKEYRTFVLCFN